MEKNLSEEEKKAIEKFRTKIKRADEDILKFSDVYTTLDIHNLRILLNLIEKQQKELNQEKEKNKELFEEYNKRVSTIIKYEQGIKDFIDETNISDIEPWSEYKIKGKLLFELQELLEE